ncbi:MAG: GNAT family N-acetyltransferase, partial [Clostridiales bacterium]|nr:GNAT family N-acetyltransferase [Clostridiales bacterium]
YYIEIDGQIVAVAAIEPDGADASLEFVATDPAHRRQGLASGVCAAAVEDAFVRGAEIVTLRAGNEGTKELYTALGFRIYNETI